MSLAKRLLSIVLAILLPPLGAWMAGWRLVVVGLCLLLFIAAQILFWGLFALPGLALWFLSILVGVGLALFPSQYRGSPVV